MRETIRKLLEAGVSRREIAARLGVDPSTVTRHARALGFPDAVRRRSLFDWAAIRAYYDEGHTIGQCRERFGFSCGAWDKAVMRGEIVVRPRSARQLSHMTRDRVEQLLARGLSQADIAAELGLSKSTVSYHCRQLGLRADPRFARRYDWEEVQRAIDEQLVAGRARQRGHVKGRLLQEGLKSNSCEICGVSEWHGRALSLELHHVNGDGNDNRLENLMLLCGNCHSQTDNWGGRGRPGLEEAV